MCCWRCLEMGIRVTILWLLHVGVNLDLSYRSRVEIKIFRDVIPCSWVERYQRFEGICCSHLKRRRLTIRWYLSATLQGFTSQKAVVLILTTVRTWDLLHTWSVRKQSDEWIPKPQYRWSNRRIITLYNPELRSLFSSHNDTGFSRWRRISWAGQVCTKS
jgi:hypothetical protein